MTFLLLSPTRAGDEPRSGRRLPRRSGTWPVWTVVVGVVVVLGVGVVSPSAHLMALDEEETSDSHETLQFLERKRSDGSGSYFYTSISSPNFPAPFTTPFSEFYVINTSTLAGQVGANHVVNIYLCELFTAEESFKIYDGAGMERVLSREVKQIPIQLRDDEVAEIQVLIINFHHQLRTKLHFHSIYGYNISLEVLDKGVASLKPKPQEQSCSVRNCSYAGRCKAFPGVRRMEFKCECLEGYSGPYCEYGPECDPRRNINFCLNGGTCRMFGYAGGRCDCLQGFGGSKCQLRKRKINFVAENRDCSESNGIAVEDRPCSLCNKFPAKPAGHRYLVTVADALVTSTPGTVTTTPGPRNVSQLLSQLFELGYVVGSQTGQVNRLIVEVFGQLSHNKGNESRSNNGTFPPGVAVKLVDSAASSSNYDRLQPSVSMNKEKEKPLLEGQEFSLTCQSRLPSHGLLEFRWFKDHVLIREDYTTRQRHISQFTLEQGDGTEIWSFLMIDNVSPFDMGIFTCQVTDLVASVQECADYEMLVVVPPQIEVIPMSITMAKNESKILMCSDSLEALGSKSHEDLQITWYKDQELVRDNRLWSTEKIFPQGTLLQLRHATRSATFTCKATNKGGVRERSVRVEVLQPWASPYDYCPQSCEVVESASSRLVWGLTAIHQTALIPCPANFTGYAQRRCGGGGASGQGKWEPTDFSRCTHEQLGHFNFTLRSMQNGYNVRSEGLSSLPSQLSSYLNGRRGDKGIRRGHQGDVSMISYDFGDSLLFGEGDKFIRMLEDTFHYVHQLNQSAPHLLQGDIVILGLVSVVDNFLGFRNSCAHPSAVDALLKHVLSLVKEFGVENYTSSHIFIQRAFIPAPTNTSSNESVTLVEIDGNSTSLTFDCMGLVEETPFVERHLRYTQLSGLPLLNDNLSLVSDVVRVEFSPSLDETKTCVRDETTSFHLHFHTLLTNTSRNKTCGGFYDSRWNRDICTLHTTLVGTMTCLCKYPGTYALLEVEEQIIIQPRVNTAYQLPPEWIATSGCIVCLVLTSRSLVYGLFRKVVLPYFLLVSTGLILSTICILHIILMTYSRDVGVTYMTLTLGIQSIRIWRLLWVGDIRELYPWMEEVSPWILLSAITFTLVGPLFTVVVVDSALATTTDKGSVLDQQSPVFITFAILIALSVLAIVLLYYKTNLRFHWKTPTINNNLHGGDQHSLSETFLQTLVHMVQILSVILYVNLRHHTSIHVLLAVATTVLGLAWRAPSQRLQGGKRRNGGPRGEEATPTLNGTCSALPTSHPNHPNFANSQRANSVASSGSVGGYKLELKPLRDVPPQQPQEPLNPGHPSLEEEDEGDDEENEPTTTLDTSVSTISHSGLAYLRPYSGILPSRMKCQLSLDDNYVLPTPK
ncbi:uncharacterized protein LOC110852123 isoform X2 [Folsomia candida]|uniref:uncharacterized protein LOC110852123 isoform X2 n=1 Tax=Folsomia candida TaxID=158441 RepID=UPI00160518C8|nr:uncharacterized protein LOC110852123 isoform X2 [Folsomia candida]